jgi:DNA/RNA endonuclease YhcR with UshA esterase domain
MRNYFRNFIDFFAKNERKIVLFLGLLLAVFLGFTFGVLKGKRFVYEPLVISIPENPPVLINSNNSINKEEKTKISENLANCVYVGSKKGTKYYPPSCDYAKKIKPENLRCFPSDEDAKIKGYEKTTSCK